MRLPGEGDPFNAGKGMRVAEEGDRPDVGKARWHADSGYLDSDEPWHSTSRVNVDVTKNALESVYSQSLPFADAEAALEDALRKFDDAGRVEGALKKCLSAGGREGSSAVVAAEKALAAAKKDGGKLKKAKAAKTPVQGKGWEVNRQVAKTHDNSEMQ